MLFESAGTYAPGEPGTQGMSQPQGQNVSLLGRYHLDQIKPYSLWVGLAGLVILAILVHQHGRRKR